eukprot:gb/GEZN01001438.1/.p1 GENE.gb/GEZN01001438.1/~~gb/GEZN01001438.1/.p1  ORF type:complete len:871 (+),score=108.09 gb/GEZN01001438.1/:380-2614(+)
MIVHPSLHAQQAKIIFRRNFLLYFGIMLMVALALASALLVSDQLGAFRGTYCAVQNPDRAVVFWPLLTLFLLSVLLQCYVYQQSSTFFKGSLNNLELSPSVAARQRGKPSLATRMGMFMPMCFYAAYVPMLITGITAYVQTHVSGTVTYPRWLDMVSWLCVNTVPYLDLCNTQQTLSSALSRPHKERGGRAVRAQPAKWFNWIFTSNNNNYQQEMPEQVHQEGIKESNQALDESFIPPQLPGATNFLALPDSSTLIPPPHRLSSPKPLSRPLRRHSTGTDPLRTQDRGIHVEQWGSEFVMDFQPNMEQLDTDDWLEGEDPKGDTECSTWLPQGNESAVRSSANELQLSQISRDGDVQLSVEFKSRTVASKSAHMLPSASEIRGGAKFESSKRVKSASVDSIPTFFGDYQSMTSLPSWPAIYGYSASSSHDATPIDGKSNNRPVRAVVFYSPPPGTRRLFPRSSSDDGLSPDIASGSQPAAADLLALPSTAYTCPPYPPSSWARKSKSASCVISDAKLAAASDAFHSDPMPELPNPKACMESEHPTCGSAWRLRRTSFPSDAPRKIIYSRAESEDSYTRYHGLQNVANQLQRKMSSGASPTMQAIASPSLQVNVSPSRLPDSPCRIRHQAKAKGGGTGSTSEQQMEESKHSCNTRLRQLPGTDQHGDEGKSNMAQESPPLVSLRMTELSPKQYAASRLPSAQLIKAASKVKQIDAAYSSSSPHPDIKPVPQNNHFNFGKGKGATV